MNKCFLMLIIINYVISGNEYLIKNCNIKNEKTVYDLEYQKESKSKLISNLRVEMSSISNKISHIKILDANNDRFEVPKYVLLQKEEKPINCNLEIGSYFKFNISDNNFTILNLFDDLEYLDDYLSFSYSTESDSHVFGFGERAANYSLSPGVYTIFPNDTGGTYIDDGKGGKNLYGTEPFTMIRNKDFYIGVLFLNTNAQDMYLSKDKNTVIRHVTIGGIIELYIWVNNSPIETIQTLHSIIGKPALPPFWALGWHQCRWGYKNTEHMRNIVKKFNEYKIPIDTIWSDIDYMQNYEDFSIDPVNFKDLPGFIDEIKKDNMHYVPILDIGIPFKEENEFYKLGKELDIFIKSNYTKKHIINKVWPGECVFPIFTKNINSTIFWQHGLKKLKEKIDYDGLWLDMNEPGVFLEGEISDSFDQNCNIYNNLTYIPGNGIISLTEHGLSLNSLVDNETFFNMKTINTFMQNRITNEYLKSINKRPFIISRSNLIGMGRYSFRWLGDNYSTWSSMKISIPSIFNFQMFGYNLVGSDICGFLYDTSDELCARWTALGALYPFSRNHNNYTSIDQEPWALGEKTLKMAKKAIKLRYSLIRYLYTELYKSSIYGGVMYQPLFFQFPQLEELFKSDIMNQQIMIGSNLMFTPALNQNEDSYNVFIPGEKWSTFPELSPINRGYIKVSGSYNDINLFIRPGSVIPIQEDEVLRTKHLENKPLTLIINFDERFTAKGDLIYDNPETEPDDTIQNKKYLRYSIEVRLLPKITFIIKTKSYLDINVNIDSLIFQQNKYIKESLNYYKKQAIVTDEDNRIRVKFSNPIPITDLNL